MNFYLLNITDKKLNILHANKKRNREIRKSELLSLKK